VANGTVYPKKKEDMKNESIYEQVAAEIAAEDIKPGLWTVLSS